MNKIIKSTGIVAASTLASRFLGFIRDMLMAGFFGASGMTDAFFVAFRIPNLLRRFVAEGSLTVSFVPVYTGVLINRGEKRALKLAQRIFTIQVLAIFILIGAGEVFSPEIVSLLGYGFDDPGKIGLTVELNRIMFPYLFFAGFVAFSMGILNSHGYFFAPAFSPVLLNIGIITGIVLLSRFFREPLYGVSIGVISGGILQLLLQIPYLIKTGFRLRFSLDFKQPEILKIFRLMGPALFSNGVVQINIVIGTIFASTLAEGSISYLYYSDRLTEIVLGVFILSLGNVILPEMSKLSAVNDLTRLKGLYVSAVKGALFIALPASAALMIAGYPVIIVLFKRNMFSIYEAEMTYRALFYASMGIPFISILRITTPAFFSLKDSKTPFKAALIALVVYIIAGFFLKETSLEHAGLSLAGSLSVTIQVIILFILLQRIIGRIGFSDLLIPLAKLIISASLMGVAVYFIKGVINWDTAGFIKSLAFLFLIVVSGFAVYFALCLLLGVEEARYLTERIRKA